MELSPLPNRKLSMSVSSEHVLKHPHTKDIHGRFKNRRRSTSVPRKFRQPYSEEIFESEEDAEKEQLLSKKSLAETVLEKMKQKEIVNALLLEEQLHHTRSSSFHHLSKEDKLRLKRKRESSKDSRSSVSSLSSSGFSLLRGQSSKTFRQQNPGRRSRSSSSGGKSRICVPAELLPEEAWAR